jgi:hypothetical protein
MVCLIIGGITLGLILLFLATLFVVSLVETINVFDIAPLPTSPAYGALTASPSGGPVPLSYEQPQDYLTTRSARAAQLGYVHAGEFGDIKHPVRVSLWISADGTTIAQIGQGSTLKLPVKKTRLLSRLANGRVLETTDAPGIADYTKMFSRKAVMDGDFDALHARHTAWLASAATEGLVQPFEKEAFSALQAIEVERAMRLEAFGYIRFVDRVKGTYRYTLKGAIMNSTGGMLIGLRDARASG